MAETKFKETEHKRLGEIAEVRRGVRVVRSQLGNGEYPVYQNSLVPLGYYDKFNCLAGTPFVIAAGAAGEIGYSKTNFWAADDCYYFICSEGLSNAYLYYYLLSQQSFIGGQVRKASIPRLNHGVISNLLVPLLPMGEQERIAGALSSVDELIASLDKQIAKTRDIKQGVMQQLLTGAKRLKGFSGQWTNKKLGGHADIYRGGSPRPIESFITDDINGINWIKIGDVDPAAKYIRSTAEKIKPSGVSSTRLVHKGDLILSNSMSFGRPYILELDGAIHDGWLVIQNYQKTFNTDFLHYALSSDAVMAQYKASAAGSSVQNLNKDKVADVVIYAPDSLDEQKHIADVLTSLDNTIENLESKRQKYESIKAGMMQQLLTGAIRLY